MTLTWKLIYKVGDTNELGNIALNLKDQFKLGNRFWLGNFTLNLETGELFWKQNTISK